MGLLPSLKVSVEKPSFEIADEVKNLMKKPPKPKKDEMPRFWTRKERMIVGVILILSIVGSLYFWWQSGASNMGDTTLPSFSLDNFSGFGFNQTVVIEK